VGADYLGASLNPHSFQLCTLPHPRRSFLGRRRLPTWVLCDITKHERYDIREYDLPMELCCSVAGSSISILPPDPTDDQPLFQFAEYSNFLTHLNLRSLRPEGSRNRAIPYGYGFNWVSLPNYFFELLGWVAFSIMTGSWACKKNSLTHACANEPFEQVFYSSWWA